MILTVTLNPSVDRTIELGGPLLRGQVNRASEVRNQPGGKGINVAGAIAAAGLPVLALLPGRPGDPMLTELERAGLPHLAIDVGGVIRTNITVAEPDGTTTKLNEPGTPLSADERGELGAAILDAAAGAGTVALCGSLPPGAPDDWYAELTLALAAAGKTVAVDTSGAPLLRVAQTTAGLLKPNSEELAELTGADGEELERAAGAGDPSAAAAASRELAGRTGGSVLTTLGGAGALLATPDGVWFATPPAITVRSTVGAGDSSLAGFLIAAHRGGDPATRLATAVAYGSAAAALPGTTPPNPQQIDLDAVRVTRLS